MMSMIAEFCAKFRSNVSSAKDGASDREFPALWKCDVSRKAKVLGKIIIPRTQVTIRYILSELEELEREEFFRLKKVLEVKYRHKKKGPKDIKEEEEEECLQCKREREERLQKAPQPPPEPPQPQKLSMQVTQITCIVCGGPMHPTDKKPVTVDQVNKENAAISDIKANLDRVLAATEHYEKTTTRKDSVLRDFKQTTTELKNKLQTRTPPASIPEGVEFEKLCDICKELYKQQQSSKEKEEECPECIKERERKEKASHDEIHKAPETCIVCCGPMYSDQKPMTAEEVNKENAAISNIKANLDKVLAATEHYERTTSKKDSLIKDFKQTTAELKSKLQERIPPASIPEDIDVKKICNLCQEMYKQQYSNCVVCGQPIAGMDNKKLAAAKESRKQLRNQLETVLGTIKKYESEGMDADKLKEFKQSTAELKKKLQGPPIPKNVNIDRLCADCKDRMKESEHSKSSKVQESPDKSKSTQDLISSVSRSKASIKPTEPTKPLTATKSGSKEALRDKRKVASEPPTPTKAGSKQGLCDKHSVTSTPVTPTKSSSKLALRDKHRAISEPSSPAKSGSKGILCSKHSMTSASPTPTKSSSRQALRDTHSVTSSVTNHSMTSSLVSSELPLGVFETEEITEVIQVKNPDGTVTEKRRVITIKRKPGALDKIDSATSSYKDKKVGLVTVTVHRKGLTKRLLSDSQSEYAIKSQPMVERMIKACVSSHLECGYDEAVENVTELDSRDTSNSFEVVEGT